MKKRNLRPVRTTGVGLHREFEDVIQIDRVSDFDSRSRSLGMDKSTQWKNASKKTLLELICLKTPHPAAIRTLAVKYQENIGESVVVYMLKDGRSKSEICKVLSLVKEVMEEMRQ